MYILFIGFQHGFKLSFKNRDIEVFEIFTTLSQPQSNYISHITIWNLGKEIYKIIHTPFWKQWQKINRKIQEENVIPNESEHVVAD